MTSPTPSVADVLGSMTGPEDVAFHSDDHPVWPRILAHAFTQQPDGTLPFHTVILGTPKKEGRSFVLAAIAAWALRHLLPPDGDLLIVGSAADSVPAGRVWRLLHRTIEDELRDDGRSRLTTGRGAKAYRVCEPLDVGDLPVPPQLVLCDDLWKFGDEWRDCWDALASSYRVVSSYAGYPDSSPLLYDLYRRGVELPPVPEFDDIRGWSDEPVVRARDGVLFYWDTVHRAPWMTSEQGQAYLAEQKRVLPPSEYLRLHHNQWCSATEEKP